MVKGRKETGDDNERPVHLSIKGGKGKMPHYPWGKGKEIWTRKEKRNADANIHAQ